MLKLTESEQRILEASLTSCDVADHCPRRTNCEHNAPEFTELLIKYGKKNLIEPGNDQHVYCSLGTLHP